MLPLQSIYKSTEIIIDDSTLDCQVVVEIRSKNAVGEQPSLREFQKWGYGSFEEAFNDDMIDDILNSDNYENQNDFNFAKNIVNKINEGCE